MRIVNGVLATFGTLLGFAACEAVVNFTARSWATKRLTSNEHDLNAEAALLLW